ncbi:MAG: hypothetical protein FWC46_09370 [Actinomycetia bacterium]|nr:hypothetical protein [Actinomycetes bacterium]
MRFMSVREFRQSTTTVWQALDEGDEIVLTNNGQPRALVVPVTGETLDEMVDGFVSARLGIAIRQMQEASVAAGTDTMTMEEIDAIIADVRREMRESAEAAAA